MCSHPVHRLAADTTARNRHYARVTESLRTLSPEERATLDVLLAVEFATGWPGLGRLMYDGVRAGDVKLVAGCVFAGGVCLAVGNLIADVCLSLLDPRIRLN